VAVTDGSECDVRAIRNGVHSNVTLNQEASLRRMNPGQRNVPEQVLDGEAYLTFSYDLLCVRDAVAHRYLDLSEEDMVRGWCGKLSRAWLRWLQPTNNDMLSL
jgi:hypothetical protein